MQVRIRVDKQRQGVELLVKLRSIIFFVKV